MKIDFYILESGDEARAQLTACELAEKAVARGERVTLYTASPEASMAQDELLWTFKPESFIPHERVNGEGSTAAVQITHHAPQPHQQGTLINLQSTMPAGLAQFQHLIEIVFPDPTVQQLARERYKQYRQLGHELNTYKI